jgi:methylmalonyl-CoA mutase
VDEVSAAEQAAWRAQVEKELRGADFERGVVRASLDGLPLQPVYLDRPDELRSRPTVPASQSTDAAEPTEHRAVAADPSKGAAAPSAAAIQPKWRQVSVFDCADPVEANRQVLADLEGGVNGLWLAADQATRLAGAGATGAGGLPLLSAGAMATVLAGVQADLLTLHLDAGVLAVPMALQLVAQVQNAGADPAECAFDFGVDPLAALARDGILPMSLKAAYDQAFDLLKYAEAQWPEACVFRIDTLPYHMAGATEAQELAIAAAALIELLRQAEDRGIEPEQVAPRVNLRFAVGRETFLEIGKLRAARVLWNEVLTRCEVEEIPKAFVHAWTSPRTATREDPWVNMLRGSTQCFAAIVAGADALTNLPFDAQAGGSGDLGRRQARNVPLILSAEAHLDEVVDPAGGSYAFEHYTQDLSARAWEILQDIEAAGGLAAALMDGFLTDMLESSCQARHDLIRRRKLPLTGVSEYADLAEGILPTPSSADTSLAGDGQASQATTDSASSKRRQIFLRRKNAIRGALLAAESGASLLDLHAALLGVYDSSEPPSIEALPVLRDAEEFEKLRDQARVYEAQFGSAPAVNLVTLGAPAEAGARLSFARNLFAAGGIASDQTAESTNSNAAPGSGATADPGSGAGAVVCLCGTDSAYVEGAAAKIAALKSAGARLILLAGHPKAFDDDLREQWKQAGLDGYVHMGCDAVDILENVHASLKTEGQR